MTAPSSVFITASGTGVGKTLVTATLGYQLKRKGHSVELLKPVLTGFPPQAGEAAADCDVLLQALSAEVTDVARDVVSPWRFEAPLSPDMAAAKQRDAIDFDAVCEFCRQDHGGRLRLIEGIGGVMVPLTARHTVLDWIEALNAPAILVVGSYLGTLSHTLTALTALEGRNIPLLAIVVSESADNPVPLTETCASLANFWPGSIVSIPRLSDHKPWQAAPDLTRLVDRFLPRK